MNDFIAWIQTEHPVVLLLIGAFLLLPSLFVFGLRRRTNHLLAWLAAALVPIVGWLVVCVLLLSPPLRSEPEEDGESSPDGRFWGRVSLGCLALAILSTFVWKSDNKPPPLPALNDPIIRSEILAFVKQLTFEWLGKGSGAPEIVQIEETPSDDEANLRTGVVTVKHQRGRNLFLARLSRVALDPGKYQLEVRFDTREMLSPHDWLVQDHLRRELEQRPEVRALKLSDRQWTDLRVTEGPSDTPQSLRRGRVELPAAEGRAPQVLDFLVHWCDQAESCAGIQLIEAALPQPSSPAFQHELKHAVQDWPPFAPKPGAEEAQLTALWMSHSDPEKNEWFYNVQVQSGEEDRVVSAVLQWRDRDLGLWEVKILDEPPAH